MTLKDRINTAAPLDVVQSAYAQVSAVQSFPAHIQALGAAYLIRAICETTRLDLSQLMDQCRRIEHDADNFFNRETKALHDYCRQQLR